MTSNLFKKAKLPDDVPFSLQKQILIVANTSSKEEALEVAYKIIIDRYRGNRIQTWLNIKKGVQKDIHTIWAQKGFYQCTTQNYLLRLLLVKSKHFKDEEIEQKLSFIWYFSLHQYLKVKISDKKYTFVDPWSNVYGVPFGQYAHGFKSGTIFKSR